jgi:hypothetical protein
MARKRVLTLFLAAIVLAAGPLWADVKTRGQIEGTVQTEDGATLPNAAVTLSGQGLIQEAVSYTTGPSGVFRFLNLNPGRYKLLVVAQGLESKEYGVDVLVGKTATVDVTLKVAGVTEAIAVQVQAPLFDKTTPSYGTNLPLQQLEKLPTTRNFIDIVDATAGMDNRMAFGAGGNVDGYDTFGFGAATNSYLFNGVSVSNLEFGNSWVNPNVDSIQEVQIVGPGGSAEYSNYSGAVVNVITKAGTNQYKGTLGVYFTNHSLTGDNSEGIKDLDQGKIKRNAEYSATLGGPIVRDKLTFFASGGLHDSATAPPGTEFYDSLNRKQYQLRLDFLANQSHTFSGSINYEPILDEDLGLQAETGPETGFYREQHTTTSYLSWVGQWGDNTLSEVRYAKVTGFNDRIPNSGLGTPSVYDGSNGVRYNSVGFQRQQPNGRYEGRAAVTHFADAFLGGSHEFKGGVEYEKAWQRTNFITSGNAFLYLFPVGAMTYVQGIVGYNTHVGAGLKRTGVYVQDRARFGRTTVSLGVRYDKPSTYDLNTDKTMLEFTQVAPRLGLVHDFAGNGRTIGRISLGRYFDKVPTYGPGTYAGTGFDPITYYGVFTDQHFDPHDWQAIKDFIIKPENITSVFDTQAIPVEKGTNGPHTDIANVGFDQELCRGWALSANYIYRKTTDYIVLTQYANQVTYEPVTYTSTFTGRTFTYYKVTGGGPREFALGNRDFNYQKTNMFIVELRGQPTSRLFLDASLTLERTVGTKDNNECGILSLCSNGVDTDPNWEKNPFFTKGNLSQNRPWNFKIRGSYTFPFNLTTSADVRWFSGRAYGAQDYCYQLPEFSCSDPYYSYSVYLEPRDARKEDSHALVNLRLAQDFKLGGTLLTASVDVTNALNAAIDFNTNIQNTVSARYSKESAEQGKVVSAFGKPYAVTTPRQIRLGLRLSF